jgi:hypothetical protein
MKDLVERFVYLITPILKKETKTIYEPLTKNFVQFSKGKPIARFKPKKVCH